MATASLKISRATIPDLVVGFFTESHSAHGALADLDRAGFRKDRVAIAFSDEGKKAQHEGPGKGHWGEPAPPASEYTLAWRLRRWSETDIHRRGVEQMGTEEKETSAAQESEHYSEVDLHDTLQALGVPEERILLLDQILGLNGVLVFVDAAERSREVEVILEKNSAQIRTSTVTERAA